MSQYDRNKIEYVVMCVFAFAARMGVGVQESLRYLLAYRGIAHLDDHYDIEHTLPLDDTLDALVATCKKNGGAWA